MIRVYRSDMVDAPMLSGTQGALLAVLDACLINGFGATTPTQITRTGGTVTVGYIAPHNYNTLDWITFAGADQPEYNGSFRVTRVDAYTLTFPIATEPVTPATTATAFAAKRTPAGFIKPFQGLNKAAYQSMHPKSNKPYLRVSDEGTASAGARYARVCAYEKMLDIDLGERRFPTRAQFTDFDGAWWCKSNSNDATGRQWEIITDGITFYLQAGTRSGPLDFNDNAYQFVNGFGQLATNAPDAYASFLSIHANQDDDYGGAGLLMPAQDQHAPSSKAANIAIARNYAGSGSVWGVPLIGHGFSNQYVLGGNQYLTYPHKTDNRFYMCPVIAYESDGGVFIRGRLPGAYESPHGRTHSTGKMLDTIAVVGLEGKRFVWLGGRGQQYNYYGGIWIDIDGPWEE